MGLEDFLKEILGGIEEQMQERDFVEPRAPHESRPKAVPALRR